jgi:hypothetical protein
MVIHLRQSVKIARPGCNTIHSISVLHLSLKQEVFPKIFPQFNNRPGTKGVVLLFERSYF